MSGSVLYKSYQIHVFSFGSSKKTVSNLNQKTDKVDIFPFVESTDIIGLPNPPLMKNKIYSSGMILYIKPIPDILPLSIDR